MNGRRVADIDIKSFVQREKGNKFEDFLVGQTFEHHWGRTIFHSDNALFSTAMCNWNPMYLNVEFARAHGHPDVVVNPMLVLSTVVSLSTEELSEAGGPFLGLDDCEFYRPVYCGDTLTARSEVLAARPSETRPGYGVVTWRTEARNQRHELVVGYTRTNLVARRLGTGS
jgi:itaconyl-CoA hydratase